MQFDLDEDRALLKQATRELLEKESPLDEGRRIMEESPEGYSKGLYATLGELGYLGLTLSEDAGGAGVGCIGLAAVLEEMGRVAFPGPYLDLVLAVEALRRAEGEEAAAWLPRLLSGETLAVIARREALGRDEPEAPATRFQDGRVRGAKTFVPFGAAADALLVTTVEGLALVPRPGSGWNATPLATLDHAQRFAEIEIDAPGTLLADARAAEEVLDAVARLAALGASALLLGIMERSLESAVSYTMERQAFGAPIATFQALQHRQADMLLKTESTRAAVYRAAWAADCDPDQFPLLSAVAKAWAGDAARFVSGETIQLHGGVGYTWEYDPHIYYKRVKTLEQFYGATRDQLEAALRAAGL